jgi:hypothetical protein
MKTWMLPWLFPVGLLATVVLFAVCGRYAGFVVIGLGLILLPPVLWRVRFPSQSEDADTQYWRFGRR